MHSIELAYGNTNVNYVISDVGGLSPIRGLLQIETVPTGADHYPDSRVRTGFLLIRTQFEVSLLQQKLP